jgi:hypothetical protein
MITKEKLLQIILGVLLLLVTALGGLLFYKNSSPSEIVVVTAQSGDSVVKPIRVVGEGEGTQEVDPTQALEAVARTAKSQKETDYLTIFFYIALLALLFFSRKKITKFINDIFEKSA